MQASKTEEEAVVEKQMSLRGIGIKKREAVILGMPLAVQKGA